jgi:voltage-gated potassium channel Kch
MRLDFGVILNAWMIVIGGALGLVFVKTTLLFSLARVFGARQGDAMKTAATLSQGGEFSFVVFTLGISAALFTNAQASLMSAIVTLSMMLTPLMSALAHRLAKDAEDTGEDLQGPEAGHDHVLIVGFGRMGQIISQVLQSSGVNVTAIDRNPSHIRNAERFGFKVYYGDGARLDMLLAAGAEDAKAIILCMDDPKSVNHAVTILRERLPNATIMAVAHDRIHEMELKPLGPDVIVRETLESSLLMARETLSSMGFDDGLIDDYVQQFRKMDRERLLAQMDHGPEAGRDLMYRRFQSPGDHSEEEKAGT